jgi:predicted RNase H-like HicB family nuclease
MVEVIYQVVARRSDDGWWALSCPTVRGAHSQVRRLDRAVEMARDAIAGVLNVPLSKVEVELDVRLPRGLKQAVESIERSTVVAREAASRAAQAQVDAARALIDDGLTLRDAAVVLHLSHQRVAQLVAKGG